MIKKKGTSPQDKSIIDELLDGNAVEIAAPGTYKLKVSGRSQKKKEGKGEAVASKILSLDNKKTILFCIPLA